MTTLGRDRRRDRTARGRLLYGGSVMMPRFDPQTMVPAWTVEFADRPAETTVSRIVALAAFTEPTATWLRFDPQPVRGEPNRGQERRRYRG